MMTPDLTRGREAFHRGAWRESTTFLARADAAAPLAVDDRERLAIASHLVGQDDASIDAWTQVHQACLDEGQLPRAVRAAFWMMLVMLARGEWARVSGWLSRCRRLLDERGLDAPESGLLLVLEARSALKRGDPAAALEALNLAAEFGRRFTDPELRAFSLMAKGQALARQEQTPEAVALLDEAMVAITTDGVSPIAVGTVYCAVIDTCHQIMDLGRMREWTELLTSWCRGQPDLVPFRGLCLVHRAEVLFLSGDWSGALQEAAQACGLPGTTAPSETAAGENPPAPLPSRGGPMGAALYQVAEIERIRGHFAEAEAAYREASVCGDPLGPGPALLRFTQGDIAGAATAIRCALSERTDPRTRSSTLAAATEIEIAAGDLPAARQAMDELAARSRGAALPWLAALLAQAEASVLLAEGDPRAALGRLRDAWTSWQDIDAPYEAARVRVLMGLAQRTLGDEEAAALEFDAAQRVFDRLGAVAELTRVDHARGTTRRRNVADLTPREHEILTLVAAGKTNRAIARQLFISERTVDRHVSNILTKLDLTSRSAATAYAYQHHLVRGA